MSTEIPSPPKAGKQPLSVSELHRLIEPVHLVEIIRTYKDDDGQLQDSTKFSRDDLPHVVYAAQRAFDYILDQTNQQDEDDE